MILNWWTKLYDVTLHRPVPDATQHSQQTDIHAHGGIRTHNPSKRAAADYALDRAATGTDNTSLLVFVMQCVHWKVEIEFLKFLICVE